MLVAFVSSPSPKVTEIRFAKERITTHASVDFGALFHKAKVGPRLENFPCIIA
jgi:hypothetical protein